VLIPFILLSFYKVSMCRGNYRICLASFSDINALSLSRFISPIIMLSLNSMGEKMFS
jgi:hypothetical protein